jgi:hypothetical protein
MLKQMGIYFFRDFVGLMSAQAIHFLVYSGIMAMLGGSLMFAWGVVYFPYALFRVILRYGLIIFVLLIGFGMLSGFGSFGGAMNKLEEGNLFGNIGTLISGAKSAIFGGGNSGGFMFNMVKNMAGGMLSNLFGGDSNNNQANGQ